MSYGSKEQDEARIEEFRQRERAGTTRVDEAMAHQAQQIAGGRDGLDHALDHALQTMTPAERQEAQARLDNPETSRAEADRLATIHRETTTATDWQRSAAAGGYGSPQELRQGSRRRGSEHYRRLALTPSHLIPLAY